MGKKSKLKGQDEIPKAMTLMEASDFWDEHSFLDYEGVQEVEFDIDIKSHRYLFAIEADLAQKVLELAKSKGISSETLLNLWIQEKVGT